jgi:hypothetical protein
MAIMSIKEHVMKNSWQYIVLIVYVSLVGATVSKHEPWFDEAQCWLLARDTNLIELFTKYLRYEGSTGLWFLILSVPSKLNFPYYSMNIISAIIATAGVYLLLRYSPFPLIIKILIPFSFFILFQYAVIARSYVLLPILLFLIAIIYENKTKQIYLFILYLCLLANVSLHGFLIALSISFIHLIDLIKRWNDLDKHAQKKQMTAFVVFLFIAALLVLQIWLPKDLNSPASTYNFSIDNSISKTRNLINNSFTETISLSTIALIVTFIWFFQKRLLLLYICIILPLLVLSSTIYSNVWHEGTLFLVWVFVMWISFEKRNINIITSKNKTIVTILIMLVLSIHIYWSFNLIKNDFYQNYSASYDLAQYIKNNYLEKKKIYAPSFHAISILPYFDDNIFNNYNNKQKPCFWLWSTKNNMIQDIPKIIEDKPDIIIIGIKYHHQENLPILPHYKLIRMFDGNIYWKDRILEKDSFALFIIEQSL